MFHVLSRRFALWSVLVCLPCPLAVPGAGSRGRFTAPVASFSAAVVFAASQGGQE